jgi:hypothetical protein
MADKKLYATYDDDHTLLEAAKKLVAKGIHIRDVFSPFPIHGLDPVIGVKRTRLAICAFIYGITGTSLALFGLWYFMVSDWAMNIGGKPNFSLYENIPSFIPVTFEFTVLCAAHGMAITYLLRNWTLPGVQAKNPYPYTTDDKFVMEIHAHDNHMNTTEIEGLLKETGSTLVEER